MKIVKNDAVIKKSMTESNFIYPIKGYMHANYHVHRVGRHLIGKLVQLCAACGLIRGLRRYTIAINCKLGTNSAWIKSAFFIEMPDQILWNIFSQTL